MFWDGTVWIVLSAAHHYSNHLCSPVFSVDCCSKVTWRLICQVLVRPDWPQQASHDYGVTKDIVPVMSRNFLLGRTWRRVITVVSLWAPRGPTVSAHWWLPHSLPGWDPSACSLRALANQLMRRSCYRASLWTKLVFVVRELTSYKLCLCSLERKQPDLLIDRNLIMMLTVSSKQEVKMENGNNNSLPSPISALLYTNPWTELEHRTGLSITLTC